MNRSELELRVRQGLGKDVSDETVANVVEAVWPLKDPIDWGPKPGLLNHLLYRLGERKGRAPTLAEQADREETVAADMTKRLAYRKRIVAARASQQKTLADAKAARGPGFIAKHMKLMVGAIVVLCLLLLMKSCFKC